MRKQLKLRSREALQAQEGVYGFLHESFRALDAIQALNIADSFSQRFQNTNEESSYRLYRYQKTMQIQTMVLDILQAFQKSLPLSGSPASGIVPFLSRQLRSLCL